MDDVLVVEAADHMDDGIGHTDVGQEFVAQSLALGGALYQTGDVHKLNDCGGGLFGVVHLGKPVQPVVGNSHHAHIGVDRAEGVVGGLCARLGDRIEKRALAHVGQTHDS